MNKPLEKSTDQALALLSGAHPEIIYLPPSMRTGPLPKGAPIEALSDLQLDRIVKVDPLGFLFAIMEGKMVTAFTAEPRTKSGPTVKRQRGRPKKTTAAARIQIGEVQDQAIFAVFHSPSIADRERVAMFLSKLIVRSNDQATKPKSAPDEYDGLVARRAAQAGRD